MNDLASFRQRDDFAYQLVLPNGEKSEVMFRLAGPTHPTRSALEKKTANRSLRQINRDGKAKSPEDIDDLKQETVDRLVACTLGWDGLVINGQEIAFSPRAARDLYSDDYYGWVRDRVARALNDIELFTQGSDASSSLTPSINSASA